MGYEVIRSRRRRRYISTRVAPDGKVQILVPYGTSDEQIRDVIAKNKDWIDRQVEAAKSKGTERSDALSAPPDELPLMGKMLPVSHEPPYGLRSHRFHVPDVPLSELTDYLSRLYRSLAEPMLTERTYDLARQHGFSIMSVTVRTAHTRWGSCSSRKKISLSWRLIAAPPEAIDYVIIHELCHTLHMDHSKEFWAEVDRIVPGRKRAEAMLKDTELLLYMYGL